MLRTDAKGKGFRNRRFLALVFFAIPLGVIAIFFIQHDPSDPPCHCNGLTVTYYAVPSDTQLEPLFGVLLNGQWGYMNRSGVLVIQPAFDGVEQVFLGELAMARKNDLYGYIDRTGKWVIPAQYAGTAEFREGLAAVLIDEKWGFIDTAGTVVVPPRYDTVTWFCDGSAAVGTETLFSRFKRQFQDIGMSEIRWSYIDRNGKPVKKPPKRPNSTTNDELLTAINRNGKYGFSNTDGVIVIQPQYEEVGRFSEGLAPVKLQGKWGVIDSSGKLVIKPQFGWLGGFAQGLCSVHGDYKLGYINRTGDYVWPPMK